MCQEWQPNRSKNKDWWAEFKPKLIESLQNCSHYLPLCCIPKIRIKVESSCGRPSVWMASAFCIQLGACGCSCRAPSRPSRLHLRVLGFFCYCFFLTINLSEAYQSSSPTCLFCHLTTPAEMMLSNTHTHRCTSHHKQQNTSKRSTNFFFAVLLKLKTCLNLSVPDVIVWLLLFISFISLFSERNWQKIPIRNERRDHFLICYPLHHHHYHHLPNVSLLKRAGSTHPPLLEDFLILWQNDKLWLTSSMWVRETWGRTACIAFCNYISFTALFLLPTLCSSSK